MASRWPRLLEQPEGIWRACNLILEFEGIVGGNSDLAVSVEFGYLLITASWDDPGRNDVTVKISNFSREISHFSSLRAESARAVTGRRCPHVGRGKTF